MPENASYLHLREEVLKLNEAGREHCLCKAIDGGCCKPNIKMLIEDQQVIVEAVERGDISRETIQRARRRAMDDSLPVCAFLGDHGECTIYPYRPVVCIQHGNGGLPKDKATMMRAIRKPGNRTIRIADIEQYSCDACAATIDPNTRIPLAIAGRSTQILVAIQQGERHYNNPRMNPFLIETFPDT